MLKFGLFAAAALTLSGAAQAQGGRWEPIGSKTVGARSDTDVIPVNMRRDFRQLQLCAVNAPVRLMDFDVRFRNDTRQDIAVREWIKPGTCTRPLDLNGRERHIERITLRYEKLRPNGRTPTIRVMGR